MAWTVAILLLLVLIIQQWMIDRKERAWENQLSKLQAAHDLLRERYDALVEKLKVKAAQPVEKPQPKRRIARNFSEFKDAAENGAVPRGMVREKPNANV